MDITYLKVIAAKYPDYEMYDSRFLEQIHKFSDRVNNESLVQANDHWSHHAFLSGKYLLALVSFVDSDLFSNSSWIVDSNLDDA